MDNHSIVLFFFKHTKNKINKDHCSHMKVQEKLTFINWLKMQEIQWAYVNNFQREKTKVFMAYFDQTSWREEKGQSQGHLFQLYHLR